MHTHRWCPAACLSGCQWGGGARGGPCPVLPWTLHPVPQAEQELRLAQAEFDRQAEVTRLLLEGISSTHVSARGSRAGSGPGGGQGDDWVLRWEQRWAMPQQPPQPGMPRLELPRLELPRLCPCGLCSAAVPRTCHCSP